MCVMEAVTMLGQAISSALAEMLHRPSEIESLIEWDSLILFWSQSDTSQNFDFLNAVM